MNCEALLKKYCGKNDMLYNILIKHSRDVANKAVLIAKANPQYNLDLEFVEQAALLHDIGVIKCNAPKIFCFGDMPYICHGYLGADILRSEGLFEHALIAERHTGTGLSAEYIKEKALPLPDGRQYSPQSITEQIICFADKFFSKTRLGQEKDIEKIKASLGKFSDASVKQFEIWQSTFYSEH